MAVPSVAWSRAQAATTQMAVRPGSVAQAWAAGIWKNAPRKIHSRMHFPAVDADEVGDEQHRDQAEAEHADRCRPAQADDRTAENRNAWQTPMPNRNSTRFAPIQ